MGAGQNGPYATRAGHDINYLGISGILECTGEHTGRPVIPGIPIGDLAGGGIFTALAIIAALFGRARTGEGQYLDVAQTDVLTSLNLLNIAEALAQKKGKRARPYNLRARKTITEMDDPQRGETIQIGFPAKFSGGLNFKRSPAPSFGQHTKEILIGLGYTHSSIQSLKEDGVI